MAYVSSLPRHQQASHRFSSCLPVFDVFQEPFIISIRTLMFLLVHPISCLSHQHWPLSLPVPAALLWEALSVHTPDSWVYMKTALRLWVYTAEAPIYPFPPSSLQILPFSLCDCCRVCLFLIRVLLRRIDSLAN